jgi:transposase
LTAVTIVAEVGSIGNFRTAPQSMAYAGVVPSEAWNGRKQHRGPITKRGNNICSFHCS